MPADDDLCRTASREAKRAFENNAFYLASGMRGGRDHDRNSRLRPHRA